jgi:hypothetical protein
MAGGPSLAADPALAWASPRSCPPLPDAPWLATRSAAAPAAALPPLDFPAVTTGRVRNVNLAITMPIAAQSAASAISWVPTSRRSSGPMFATGAAAPAPAAGCAAGLGVAAGIDGSSEPILPPVVVVTPPGTIGKDPAGRPAVVVTGAGMVFPEEAGAGVADTVAVTVADAVTETDGFVAVSFAASCTCSPLVLDLGTATAAWSSNTLLLASLLILQVLVWPVGHTAKWGVAAVGFVVRVTLTSVESAPADERKIAKSAVPPGFTLELPPKTSTLSHSLTEVGAGANAAANRIEGLADAEAPMAELEAPFGAAEAELRAAEAELGAAEAELGAADAELGAADAELGAADAELGAADAELGAADAELGAADAELGAGVVAVGADVAVLGAEVAAVGVVVGAFEVADGEGDGDREGDGSGDGFGFIVPVTHGCGAAWRWAALVLLMVPAVVPTTTPTMHKPVATLATADLCLRTLTRLTPFLRSSVGGSSFTRCRHTMRCLRVVLAASAWSFGVTALDRLL